GACDLLVWEHRYDSSRTRAEPRFAKNFVEKDLGGNPSQLGLEKLEQGRVECARSPSVSAQARRDRVDHQFSRGVETVAGRQIARLWPPALSHAPPALGITRRKTGIPAAGIRSAQKESSGSGPTPRPTGRHSWSGPPRQPSR